MTAKEWFEQGMHLETEIKALKTQALRAEKMYRECVSESGKERASKKRAKAQYLAYQDAINCRLEQFFKTELSIYQVILKVPSATYRTLLSLRYLSRLTWEEVAEVMEVDVRHVYRLHRSALSSAEPFIPQNI
jgi:DNA-directed RNA polymerase specialized sigma subunit